MTPEQVLSIKPKILTQKQREFYFENGYILLEKLLSDDWIDKLRADPTRDAQWTAEVRVVADEYAAELAALPAGVEPSPELQEIRWMIEELRVSLYAHPMRTRYPVSVRRIQQAIDAL